MRNMRNFIGLLLVLGIYDSIDAKELGWGIYPLDQNRVYLSQCLCEYKYLVDAISSVESGVRIYSIVMSDIAPDLQREIKKYLLENHEEILSDALTSSGNMHNPKMVRLSRPIKKAIQQSSWCKV